MGGTTTTDKIQGLPLKKSYPCDERDFDAASRTGAATITVRRIDREEDVIEASGVRTGEYMKNPIVCLNHDYGQLLHGYGLPIGRTFSIDTDETKMHGEWQFATTDEHPLAEYVFQGWRKQFINMVSATIAPDRLAPMPPEFKEARGVYVPSGELWEYSICTIGLNQEALRSKAMKSAYKEMTDAAPVFTPFFAVNQGRMAQFPASYQPERNHPSDHDFCIVEEYVGHRTVRELRSPDVDAAVMAARTTLHRNKVHGVQVVGLGRLIGTLGDESRVYENICEIYHHTENFFEGGTAQPEPSEATQTHNDAQDIEIEPSYPDEPGDAAAEAEAEPDPPTQEVDMPKPERKGVPAPDRDKLLSKSIPNSGKPSSLPHLMSKLFERPVAIEPTKLETIISVVADRRVQFEDIAEDEERERSFDMVGGVAVIPVMGTLVQRAFGLNAMSGLASYEKLSRQFHEALTDPGVSAIALDLDSPGGEVSGLFDFADTVYEARGQKPIWAMVNESAFSAAYAIASAADKIVVPRTGQVGSIGVIAAHIDQSQFDEAMGLTYTFITAGEHKADFNAHEPLPDDVRERVQAEVDAIYDIFVASVARNRGLEEQAVRETEALTYMGDEAVAIGLADEVMPIKRAMQDLMTEIAEPDASAVSGEGEQPELSAEGSEAEQPEAGGPQDDDTDEETQAERDAYSEGQRLYDEGLEILDELEVLNGHPDEDGE